MSYLSSGGRSRTRVTLFPDDRDYNRRDDHLRYRNNRPGSSSGGNRTVAIIIVVILVALLIAGGVYLWYDRKNIKFMN